MKTRIDWFLTEVVGGEIEIPDDARELLVEAAGHYLAVQGSMPWERWMLLSTESRAIFLDASDRRKVRMALEGKAEEESP